MAAQALSTIGMKIGWGLGTMEDAPTSFKQLEGCISISSVEVTQDKLDATPLEAKRKQYVAGHEDTGGELQTVFNDTDTFDAQWEEMVDAYEKRESGKTMWLCAWHKSKSTMPVYIIEPGSLPAPEFGVGTVRQYTITSTLVDLPKAIEALEPTAPLAPTP